MGHANELDLEGTDGAPAAERHDLKGKAIDQAHLGELRFEHLGGEGRGVDRDAAKLRPEIDDRAEMILMGVREQEAGNVVPLLHDEADIRENDINARLKVAAESDTHVDDEPVARAVPSIAVEVEIHADLAHAAERQEDELGPLSIRFSGHVGL